jgi:hypothetical protein
VPYLDGDVDACMAQGATNMAGTVMQSGTAPRSGSGRPVVLLARTVALQDCARFVDGLPHCFFADIDPKTVTVPEISKLGP